MRIHVQCLIEPQRLCHGARTTPGHQRLVVAQASRNKRQTSKKRKGVSTTRSPTIRMPRSRDDAINQAALALRTHYRNALSTAPKRGISEEVVGAGAVVTSYCICPTNSSELSLSQDIAAAMLGSATGTCVFVTDSLLPGADVEVVSFADAIECDADYFVCVAPKNNEIMKVDELVRELEESRRRTCPFVLVVNPEWAADLGDGGWNECSVTDTAYCFFPILIKPLMMKTLEGVVYKTTTMQADDKPWKVWAGNEQVGQMAVRPSTSDVESILYNAIAAKNKKDGNGVSKNPFTKLFG